MKYALIGCGRISTNHIKAALNNKLDIVAVCDVVEENMKSVLEKHGIDGEKSIKRYVDYKKRLKRMKFNLSVLRQRVVFMQK